MESRMPQGLTTDNLVDDTRRWAYTTKTRIAAWVDEQLSVFMQGKVSYFVYFTLNFHASHNASTSNPLEIYKILDEAVKYGYRTHPKIFGLSQSLQRVVTSRLAGINDGLMIQIVERISAATVDEFRPEVWKFDLNELIPAAYIQLYDDEFITADYSLPPDLIRKVIP